MHLCCSWHQVMKLFQVKMTPVLSCPDDIAIAHGHIPHPSVGAVVFVVLHDLQVSNLQLGGTIHRYGEVQIDGPHTLPY